MSTDAVQSLLNYSWPGNVRELQNSIRRAALVAGSNPIESHHLGLSLNEEDRGTSRDEPVFTAGQFPSLDAVEAAHIRRDLERSEGKIYGNGGAAELLGLKPSTLQSRMKKMGIKKEV